MPGRDIFISHSSKDDSVERLACQRLEQAGYSCWFAPRDTPQLGLGFTRIVETNVARWSEWRRDLIGTLSIIFPKL
jgi:hypothetical protein